MENGGVRAREGRALGLPVPRSTPIVAGAVLREGTNGGCRDMRILWINPSFLDYRIPVYDELSRLTGDQLSVVYSEKRVPSRIIRKVRALLGEKAIALKGERVLAIGGGRIGLAEQGGVTTGFANKGLEIPYQPGLLRCVLEHRCDVVIGEGFFQWSPLGLLKRMAQGTPFILSYERTAHTERCCPAWRSLYRRTCLRFIDAAICNGKLCREYLVSLGMASERVVTGGMAADSTNLAKQVEGICLNERAELRRTWGLSTPVFLYVGQLTRRKGVAELLAGWKMYKDRCCAGGTLLIAGSGDQMASLQAMVFDRSLSDVRFIGQVDYDEIAWVYAVADILIMPTLEDNWSLVVPEAMACGLPILCSRYNGCWPDLVHKGRNGWVFDPLDAEDIACCLLLAWQHRDHLVSMGLVSAEIEKNFSPDKAARAILNACEIAIN